MQHLSGGCIQGSNSSVVHVIDTTFIKNEAEMGGVMHISDKSTLDVDNCTFIKNAALPKGLLHVLAEKDFFQSVLLNIEKRYQSALHEPLRNGTGVAGAIWVPWKFVFSCEKLCIPSKQRQEDGRCPWYF